LARSRDRLLSGITGALGDKDSSLDEKLSNLEAVLLQADIGSVTTTKIIDDLRSYARREGLKEDDILPILRARLIEALKTPAQSR
jgi:signal recognition particle GTPase